jgi:hypothetical protein
MEGLAAGSGTPGPPTRLAITAANGIRNATWTHVVWPMPFAVGFLLVFGVFVGAMWVWEWRNGNGVGLVTRQTRWAGHCLLYYIGSVLPYLSSFFLHVFYLCTSNEYLFHNFPQPNKFALTGFLQTLC